MFARRDTIEVLAHPLGSGASRTAGVWFTLFFCGISLLEMILYLGVKNNRCGGNDRRRRFYAVERNGLSGDIVCIEWR